ncbi:MAG: TIM barrel protein [Thermodesulfovibrionaceae bacterium]
MGHLYLSSNFYKFDPVEELIKIRDLIAHCHIHDNFGKASYFNEKQQNQLIPFGKGDSYMPIGWGIIPFETMLKTFIDNYKGILVMEIRNRYFRHMEESRKKFTQNNIKISF